MARFNLHQGLTQPFVDVPLFDLPLGENEDFARRELERDSEDYEVIENYVQQTCSRRQNTIRTQRIWQYRHRNQNEVVNFGTANWLLWMGIRRETLEEIEQNGLQLPERDYRRALFFTPTFAMALHYTDIKDIKFENALNEFRGLEGGYQNQLFYVLLCEVALGEPVLANVRYRMRPLSELDAGELDYREKWQFVSPHLYRRGFPVARYQTMDQNPTDALYDVNEMISYAERFPSRSDWCNSVYVNNASMEPFDATVWRGRVLPDGNLTHIQEAEGNDFADETPLDFVNNTPYGNAFVWNTNQVAIRYIVEFKAERISYLNR